jgi:DNA-binding NarL/FixJ family response regulator
MHKKKLTNRELEILRAASLGYTCKQIANHYHNVEQTIKNHMYHVRIKLKAINTPHAVAIAKDRGLI